MENKHIIDNEEYENFIKEDKKSEIIIKYGVQKQNKFKNLKEFDIKDTKELLKYIKKEKSKITEVIFYFDFSQKDLELQEADNILKEIKRLQKILYKNKGKKVYVCINRGKSRYEQPIEDSIGLFNIYNKEEKYNYLYDKICDYLDDIVIKNNVCGFENNKCRVKKDTNCTMGCCHHYKNKYYGILFEKEMKLCEYQKDKGCTAKCISCKMFMCDDLEKIGYKFTTKNVLLIKRYFNFAQKIIILTSHFTPKEKIMKKLLIFAI